MKEASEGAAKAVSEFEAETGVALGDTWHQRLEALASKGFLRSDTAPTLAADVVREINLMVHELRAAAAGPEALRMLSTGDILIPDSDAEADSYLHALTQHATIPMDDGEVERAAALAWLHELGIEADRLTRES